MPIYEFECKKCNEIFEVIQKVDDPPPKKHSCGSTRVHKVMSKGSFVLKGEGWYLTDYSDKHKNDKARQESLHGKNDSGKSDKKTTSTDKNAKTATVKSDAGSKKQSAKKSSEAA